MTNTTSKTRANISTFNNMYEVNYLYSVEFLNGDGRGKVFETNANGDGEFIGRIEVPVTPAGNARHHEIANAIQKLQFETAY